MMKPMLAAVRWFATLAVALFAVPALADPDPPARVGRLADVAGQVWIYDQHAGEWIAASRNRPITGGDRLSTEDGARAEVQVGSVAWRLDRNSEVEVLQLDDAAIRLQLHAGSVALRARNREAAQEVEVLTDEGRFVPRRAGHFRIDRDDDVSAATVWSGALHFRSDDSELEIDDGQRIEFWQDAERTHFTRLEPVRDAFSEWVLAEDARDVERSASTRYVSPEMPGVEDLDRHGRWERDTEYGSLWLPYSVAPGWAPYRYGHWAHVAPWGWSWVDDAPWGFAPFHYGRWVHYSGRWGWAPGAYVARPVFAPALVAWIGTPRFSIGVNVGGSRAPAVGWFPLGPREIYVPGYRVSPTYIRSVNVAHVRVPPAIVRQPTMAGEHNRYMNRFVPNAVTAVASDVIARRQPVARHADPRMVREIERQPVTVALPVAQTRRAAPPPAPNRLAIDQRVMRQRGERPFAGHPVPEPPAPQTRPPSGPVLPLQRTITTHTPAPQVIAPGLTGAPPAVPQPSRRIVQPSQRIERPALPPRTMVAPPRVVVTPQQPAQPIVVPQIAPRSVAPPPAAVMRAAPPMVMPTPRAAEAPRVAPSVRSIRERPEAPSHTGAMRQRER